jgi:hypothetical protein
MTDIQAPPAPGKNGSVLIRFLRPLTRYIADPHRLAIIIQVFAPGSESPLPPERYQNEITGPLARADEQLKVLHQWKYPDQLEIHLADGGAIFPGMIREIEDELRDQLTIAGYAVRFE